MGAPRHLPGIGRLLQTDSRAPNPANPHNYNRYSYTYPAKYIDPNGSAECSGLKETCYIERNMLYGRSTSGESLPSTFGFGAYDAA